MKLRLIDGMSFSSCVVTTPPICFDEVSTIGVSAVTVTCSSTPPIDIGISIATALPTSTRTAPRWYFLKPDSVAVTS